MRKSILMAALAACLPVYMSDVQSGVALVPPADQASSAPVAEAGTATAGEQLPSTSADSQSSSGDSGNVQPTAASDAAVAQGGISDTTSAAVVESESTPVGADSGNAVAPAAEPTSAAILDLTPGATDALLSDGASASEAVDQRSAGAHLSYLDHLLAQIESKIAVGVHVFAHEVTAARDHLAKLL